MHSNPFGDSFPSMAGLLIGRGKHFRIHGHRASIQRFLPPFLLLQKDSSGQCELSYIRLNLFLKNNNCIQWLGLFSYLFIFFHIFNAEFNTSWWTSKCHAVNLFGKFCFNNITQENVAMQWNNWLSVCCAMKLNFECEKC